MPCNVHASRLIEQETDNSRTWHCIQARGVRLNCKSAAPANYKASRVVVIQTSLFAESQEKERCLFAFICLIFPREESVKNIDSGT
jgi:hypothetical protein